MKITHNYSIYNTANNYCQHQYTSLSMLLNNDNNNNNSNNNNINNNNNNNNSNKSYTLCWTTA